MNRYSLHILIIAFSLFFNLYTISISWAQPARQMPFGIKNTLPTEKQLLSGTGSDSTVTWDFKCSEGRNSGKWDKIKVPSCWELQGYGTYNYGHDKDKAKEFGQYKYKFKVPETWKKKIVNIVFDGSMTDTEVRINGKLAGEKHQGAFYRFKYNITDHLKYKKDNLLEVTVYKQSTDTSVNRAERDADYWIFGGIFRPVYLEALPELHIEHFAVDARADGSIRVIVKPNYVEEKMTIEGQIMNLDTSTFDGPAFYQGFIKGESTCTLRGTLTNPRLWTAETPNQYLLRLNLRNEKGVIVHTVFKRIGFRTVELRPHDGFYVNGARIIFKGACRHSFWPSSGRTTNKTLSLTDVKLMKEMNMNAVRMSHYPPDEHFLDVCDSLGLFVLDELAGWQKRYDTPIGKKLVRQLVERDVNHPSIVIWDNGNEGGNNLDLDDDFKIYDPQNRPVIHPWAIFRNTDTQHYRPYDCCVGSLNHGREVFFPTEFQHGLFDGGMGAGMDDMWKLMTSNPLSAGGFLWCWSDEGVVRTDKNDTIDVAGSNAPDGIVGPYREKEASFYTLREIWSPVQLQPMPAAFNGSFQVKNLYQFTNLNKCHLVWKLLKYPGPTQGNQLTKVIATDSIQFRPTPPNATDSISLNGKTDWRKADALKIVVYDRDNKPVYEKVIEIKTAAELAQNWMKSNTESVGEIKPSETDASLKITVGKRIFSFDKVSATLSGIELDGQPVSFGNGPIPSLGKVTGARLKHFKEGNTWVVQTLSAGDLTRATWHIYPNGWIKLDYGYQFTGTANYLGINFDYPEDKVKSMRWLGAGPYRVWKNRLKGVNTDVWEKKYNNTRTGMDWVYPEFKGYHANLLWAKFETSEQPITIVSETDDLYLRVLTPQFGQSRFNPGNTIPAFPSGGISVMHAIPPIGDKFNPADQYGPQGEKNLFFSYKNNPMELKGTLWFLFGGE